MNSKYTQSNLKLNDGLIENSEIPLFVGLSSVVDKLNGRTMKMAVSIDRTWIWARFPLVPSKEYRTHLRTWGFNWSDKRKGWGCEVSEFAVNKLRSLGALTLPAAHNMPAMMPKQQVMVSTTNIKRSLEDRVDMDEYPPKQTSKKSSAARKPKSYTIGHAQAEPTAISLYDSEGQYIGLDYNQPQPAPTNQIATPTTMSSEQIDLMAVIAKQQEQIAQLMAIVAAQLAK